MAVPLAVAEYDRHWYEHGLAEKNWWNGWPIVKHPNDMIVYQELIWQTQPELVVETGTFTGGSALFLANMLDVMGPEDSRVVSVDIIVNDDLPDHPRIDYLQGITSVDLRVVEKVREMSQGRKTMVVLDSDHTETHVLKELKLYAPLVSKGCYLVVEDTHPLAVYDNVEDGYPAGALKKWNPAQHGFQSDPRRERFGFSQNPGGYLKRIK